MSSSTRSRPGGSAGIARGRDLAGSERLHTAGRPSAGDLRPPVQGEGDKTTSDDFLADVRTHNTTLRTFTLNEDFRCKNSESGDVRASEPNSASANPTSRPLPRLWQMFTATSSRSAPSKTWRLRFEELAVPRRCLPIEPRCAPDFGKPARTGRRPPAPARGDRSCTPSLAGGSVPRHRQIDLVEASTRDAARRAQRRRPARRGNRLAAAQRNRERRRSHRSRRAQAPILDRDDTGRARRTQLLQRDGIHGSPFEGPRVRPSLHAAAEEDIEDERESKNSGSCTSPSAAPETSFGRFHCLLPSPGTRRDDRRTLGSVDVEGTVEDSGIELRPATSTPPVPSGSGRSRTIRQCPGLLPRPCASRRSDQARTRPGTRDRGRPDAALRGSPRRPEGRPDRRRAGSSTGSSAAIGKGAGAVAFPARRRECDGVETVFGMTTEAEAAGIGSQDCGFVLGSSDSPTFSGTRQRS